MCRKLIYLAAVVLVLGLVSNVSAELVGYWNFDEGSGTTVADSSGSGNDGTFVGSPLWVPGRSGTALEFDGDDWVDCGDILDIADAITIACWVNPAGLSGDNGWVARWDVYAFKSSGTSLRFTTPGILDYTANNTTLEIGEWQHVAVTFVPNQTGGAIFYLDGVEAQRMDSTAMSAGGGPFGIGNNRWSQFYEGMIDDVRVYNHILTEPEIQAAMEGGKGYPYALGPVPKDGALHEDTWVNLAWRAGDFAVSHDVYLGENFDDVNNGAEGTFQGNQLGTSLVAGFPGFAYPDGLVPGTTYYWRVDEVNDADPNSPWKGDVWSFWIPPKKAYEPNPADSVKFVNTDVELSWNAGFGGKLHTVYFGDNFSDVNSAAGGIPQGPETYIPGTLELDKDYYWRVDEFDGVVTHKGDTWSFRTLPEIPITDPNLIGWWTLDEGMGVIVLDWSGHGNGGTLANGPQWVPGNDGDALVFDGRDDYVDLGTPSELYIPENYTYTAWFKVGENINGDSGAQYLLCIGSRSDLVFGIEDGVGIDGDLSLHYYDTAPGFHAVGVGQTVWSSDEWHMVAGTKDSTTGHKIYLDGELRNSDFNTNDDNYATSRMISIGAMGWNSDEYFNGTIDDVRIYNRTLTQDEIKQVMRGDPLLAWSPKPSNGSIVYIRDATPLSWSPGDNASQHDVYFGIDKDAVADADTSDTTGIYRSRQSGTSYTPLEGVEWGGGPYYWRIDEYNTDGTISTGRTWSFSVANYLTVDDFEDYDVGNNEIWWAWIDGLGYSSHPTLPAHPGNGTGSMVGDETTGSYMEETIVHGGGKSMPLFYDNNQQGKLRYSEVEKTLSSQRDWTEEGVGVLSIWFYGVASNAAEPLYVALNGSAVVTHDNPNSAQIETWTEWPINLQAFADQGVNLANVNTIAIGLGNKKNPAAGGSGTMYFDDIRLYRPAP